MNFSPFSAEPVAHRALWLNYEAISKLLEVWLMHHLAGPFGRAFLIALALTTLNADSASAQQSARQDLVIGVGQYPSTLHPNLDSMLAKSYVLGATQRPLTAFDAAWEPRCYLCVELPTLENGKAAIEDNGEGGEGIALTYTIDPEARWGDGTPITSEDILFTWEVGRHPSAGVSNAELYRDLTSVDIVDDKTFVLHDRDLGFNYFMMNDLRPIPAHLERPIFETDPTTYRNRTLYQTDPTNRGLWFGPYRIGSVNPGADIVLVRNEQWWGGPPEFDRVVIRTIENTSALESNLLSGEIDMIEGSFGLTIDQALAFEARHGEDYEMVYTPGLFYEHIDLMLDNPILADKQVRQALLYALDRETLTEQLFQGHQPVADTSVHPLDWVHTDNVRHYDHDPDQAVELLEAAGWTEIRDGVRHNAAGEPLRLELMTTAGDRNRELVQQVLQDMWKQVGVDVRIRNEPARVFFSETTSKRRFDAMALFAWISSPENVPQTTLHSDAIPSEENGWSGQNYTGFSNERMDAIIDELAKTLDRDTRERLWHELQAIYAEELPVLPLFFRAQPHIWPKWLEGVEPTGQMAPVTLAVETWQRAD